MSITATKKKKDGLTQYRVRVNIKQPDGSFKYVERTAYGRDEARKIESELRAGSVSAKTLSALVKEYNLSRTGQVRQTTAEKTDSYLRLHVLPTLGSCNLDRLSLPILQGWKNELSAKPLSVISKNNIYTAFSAVLNYGVKMEYLKKNNLATLGGFRDPNLSPERFRYYTAEQFKLFMDTLPQKNFVDRTVYVFFMVAFYTGARKGEINALRWTDIEGDVIHIRRSVAQKVKGSQYVETPPKNKSSYRDIRMPKVLRACLDEHLAFCKTFPQFSKDWRVCGGPDIISDNILFFRNRKNAKAAGLPKITIHEFRHSHATLLINAGVNIKEISRRLGHATVDMTWNVYSHLYPDQEEKALAVLDSIP